jgi:hypothetical protein
LLQDIARSTLAIGLFSGALTVAAACGVPTVFVWKEGWFYTPDLACFGDCFADPEEALIRVRDVVTDRSAYARWRGMATAAAEKYYAGRRCATVEEALGSR